MVVISVVTLKVLVDHGLLIVHVQVRKLLDTGPHLRWNKCNRSKLTYIIYECGSIVQ